ncbi:MAG: glycine/sarcosine/betaine reductase selenoprotein B family protein [candidate division NC10 bacterium]|mgnify:FL=1
MTTVPPRSDASWIAPFRVGYAAWFPSARPLIERHDYAAAFKTYPWPTFVESPWTELRAPLASARLAVVTTGGLYRPGADPPFHADAPDGDMGYRAIPRDTAIGTLGIAHAHFAHEVAEADMNTIFPLERLEELVRAGALGDLAPTHYSTMGYATDAALLAETTAPAIAARMRDEGVDVALIVPV